jgi:hypothetical protein
VSGSKQKPLQRERSAWIKPVIVTVFAGLILSATAAAFDATQRLSEIVSALGGRLSRTPPNNLAHALQHHVVFIVPET